MIKKLKRRFIILAMTSLAIMLAVIVAGMNIVNYEKVVRDADARLEVLDENKDRLLARPQIGGSLHEGGEVTFYAFGDDEDSDSYEFDDDDKFGDSGSDDRDDDDSFEDDDSDDHDDADEYFGRRGPGGPSMTRDEADESRFFTVTVDSYGNVYQSDLERIHAVDSDEAEEYAARVLASGKEKGFVNDFRYTVSDEGNTGAQTITFLDCGRILESFRDFLKYSVMMSALGLLLMFAVITYFAGRIVRPVAESYEKQKRFITDAGHEIKTPLAIIKANIDVLNLDIESGIEGSLEGRSTETSEVISEKSADELRDSLSDINDQVDRLTGLTNDLVYLSRMEEEGSSMLMMKISLTDLVRKTADSFKPLASEKGKEIAIDAEEGLFVNGSSKELEKLLSILLQNAVKYSIEPRVIELGPDECGMPAPPVIQVKLMRDGKNALIEVINGTESDVTNESLAHVFDRFYRMDSSRNSETGGHGIGLSMAKAIVDAHGGKISAHTITGRDFMIAASLPLV